MKKQTLFFVMVIFWVSSVSVMAYGEKKAASDASAGSTVAAETPKDIGNKICPVSGHEVGEMGAVVQHEHQGKVYNFCCKMCLKDFDKDPAKYGKIAEDEAAKSN